MIRTGALASLPLPGTIRIIVEDDKKPKRGVKTSPRPPVFTLTGSKSTTATTTSLPTLAPPDVENEARPSVWATYTAGRSTRREKRKLAARGTTPRVKKPISTANTMVNQAEAPADVPAGGDAHSSPQTATVDDDENFNALDLTSNDAMAPYKFASPTPDDDEDDDDWALRAPRHPVPASVTTDSPRTANKTTPQTTTLLAGRHPFRANAAERYKRGS
ncbi:hypothetical protein EDB89DRAFT_1902558 [Lactarius sanguifluus]|nr:hypothetical protein EDB89DRAFT_1902558 [Lactarius sanguifluus]